MFEFLKKLWVAYYRLVLGCCAIILAIAAIGAVLNFISLAAQGRLNEAATAYIYVAVFGALVAFGVWVHCDATAASRRLEKYIRKAPPDEVEEDDDEATTPPSELIRPAPGQDR